jgi:peptidyl-prolyl cis-trans isomerase D
MAITLIPGRANRKDRLQRLGRLARRRRGVLATIGDQTVTVPEVQREARAMIRQQFPKGGPQASMLLPYFASQAAEQLINEKALVAEAHRMGLRVNDDELREELQHGQLGSMLFPEGKFVGQEAYEEFVQHATT